jgi:hypothetical protein
VVSKPSSVTHDEVNSLLLLVHTRNQVAIEFDKAKNKAGWVQYQTQIDNTARRIYTSVAFSFMNGGWTKDGDSSVTKENACLCQVVDTILREHADLDLVQNAPPTNLIHDLTDS